MRVKEFKNKIGKECVDFKEDERGTFTLFMAATFTTMIFAAGFAWDVIRYEAMRTHIQFAIDNASLAAAALDQAIDPATGNKMDPETVANNYLDSVNMPYDVAFQTTAEINTATERKVNISAVADLDTYFLTVAGQKVLTANVESSAYEKYNLVEISLVLDISGSMGSPTKIGSLITGAQNFVSSMLSANTQAEPNIVSINLIPYSTYVNAGPELFDAIGLTHEASGLSNAPGAGYCLSFDNNAYNETDFPSSADVEQEIPYGYTNWYNYDNISGNHLSTSPYCTVQEWAQIMVMSNDETALNGRIGDLQATTNTSIDDGVKWGAALLDPTANSVIQTLTGLPSSNSQSVDSGFSNRPSAYCASSGANCETNKYLVVMTDGINTTQYSLRDNYDSATDSPPQVWYNEGSDSLSYSSQSGSGWDQLSWPELWSIETVADYVYYSPTSDGWSTYMDYSRSGSQKDTNLDNICDEAKTNGVKIYTIAYEASSSSAQTMLDCSSGINYAYTASESDIDSVFSNIGSGIKKLQLVD